MQRQAVRRDSELSLLRAMLLSLARVAMRECPRCALSHREAVCPTLAAMVEGPRRHGAPRGAGGCLFPLPSVSDDVGAGVKGRLSRGSQQRVGRRQGIIRDTNDCIQAANWLAGCGDADPAAQTPAQPEVMGHFPALVAERARASPLWRLPLRGGDRPYQCCTLRDGQGEPARRRPGCPACGGGPPRLWSSTTRRF